MKTKINLTGKSFGILFLSVVLILTAIGSQFVSGSAEKITITNEHLFKKSGSGGVTLFKYTMDISFPNPSAIRNPLDGKIVSGTYSVKLIRIDGKHEKINAYVAMDYTDVKTANYVQVTIFDSSGTKPLATSKSISIKDAEIEN